MHIITSMVTKGLLVLFSSRFLALGKYMDNLYHLSVLVFCKILQMSLGLALDKAMVWLDVDKLDIHVTNLRMEMDVLKWRMMWLTLVWFWLCD
jgi:hypothetical protein